MAALSTSAAHASAFFREVLAEGAVWTIADDKGHPAPLTPEGQRALPFWSKPTRAQRIVDGVAAYEGFHLVRLDLDDWTSRVLPDLEANGMLVGINWSGSSAQGYDLTPEAALSRLRPEKPRTDD